MEKSDFILGEHDPSHRRVLREEHSIIDTNGGRLTCRCGWFMFTHSALLDKDMAEELAWLHISKPELIIAESSDVLKEGRISRL